MSTTRIYLKVDYEKLQKARGKVRPSDLARELEVTPQVFASYESGLNRVPADVLIKWCELVSLQPADVIVEEDKKVIKALVAA